MKIADLINPKPESQFAHHLREIKELKYGRHPLGRAPLPKLPSHLNIESWRFGRPTFKGNSVEDCLIDLDRGTEPFDFRARNYYLKKSDRNRIFGCQTGADWSGRVTRLLLRGGEDADACKATIVSSQLEDFQRKCRQEIGKAPDRRPEFLPGDFIFGRPSRLGECSSNVKRAVFWQNTFRPKLPRVRRMLLAIHSRLKKFNFRLEDLMDQLRAADRHGSGRISITQLKQLCEKIELPLRGPDLTALLIGCSLVDSEGNVDLAQFFRYLDWRNFYFPPELTAQSRENENWQDWGLGNSEENRHELNSRFHTVTSEIGSSTTDWKLPKTAGVPTIRLDLSLPSYRKLGDTVTYGGEGTVADLLHLSSFYRMDISQIQLQKPRSPDEAQKLLRDIGLEIDENAWKKIWNDCRLPDGSTNWLNLHQALLLHCFPTGVSKKQPTRD